MAATVFGAASAGAVSAYPVTDVDALANGTISFFRAFASNGTTALLDGSVGVVDSDIIVNSTTTIAGEGLSIITWAHVITK